MTVSSPDSGNTDTPTVCLASLLPDRNHTWHFDGDDPYVVCGWCGERRDALTGRRIGEAPDV